MSRNLPGKDAPVQRSFGIIELRAVDDGYYIEGHPAVYDQLTCIGGWFDEVIERGAFDGCDFSDVVFTVNHDLDEIPLARCRSDNGDSTMQIRTDDRGLYFRASLDVDNNNQAKALHSATKRKDINGMSFIFYVAEEAWEGLDTNMPTRRIKKVKKVIEVSAVTWAAYPGTDINARDKSALDQAKATLENVRQHTSNDDQELELMKLRTQILLKG
ncbi:HK97 family phage prohead protease [Tumebacillus flagellatus]|uniref:Peptidase U35 n=1 Tax=Tumebacillus flagellatus TaxID=1157490 RepID=A0A074LNS8_9BACL|nr:HK97 family phage prohead protease [Tumebacillus flagellatus]KEO81498.1 peptidase U35 [Tumebacillus flagellatus]